MKYRDSEGNLQEIYLPPTGDTLPIGFIGAYSGTTAPTNWLICDGSAVSRTTYSELFNVIGTTYGEGDGSTTFNLPNLKGKVITGLDSEDTDFDTLGENGGEKTHKLTVAEMPSHSHTFKDGLKLIVPSGQEYGVPDYVQKTGSTITTNKAGGDQAHNNLQPYIVQNYIIKAKNSVGLVGNVTNEYSESTQDSYSCDYINKNGYIDESRYYQVGETWGYDTAAQPIYANGFITSSATSIRFDLYLPKSLEHITNVTLNDMSVIVRGISGYIPSSSGITSSDENITFTLYKRDGNRLSIVITGATAFSNATNNTPVSVEVRTYNLSFS